MAHAPYKTPTLVGEKPKHWLLHGPTKRYIDNYHYHSPGVGIVASYTPLARDVKDHFNIFRGVDQVESFAQASVVSLATFSECKKMKILPVELSNLFVPTFISIGEVNYHSYLEKGQTFINIGCIKFYKFRQMVCDGRIYKVPPGLNLDEYFKDFTDERLLAYDVSKEFKLVAELKGITGRAIKKEIFNSL
ncbi:hypothetical protein DJ568_16590 [Mucilaginibacter hurinus]|uniref:Uncharacterized protein n=1 Tax=Mucilaginibacter hurinus TaxID=2201324 RepID=A0A367GLT8_9SPHI|nr:hypothetical protein [Mucilaginibacter hurinus]RCH53653.1 hypothetical protein DJ568_16590 [Mucilaginibacter hurinus]